MKRKKSKREFESAVERNIKILVTFLADIHDEKADLLTNMFQLYKANFEMEKLMQMSLLKMLSISEFSSNMSPESFKKMSTEHSTHHGVQ